MMSVFDVDDIKAVLTT